MSQERSRTRKLDPEPDEEMSDEELARLNDALARGFESIRAGRFRPARTILVSRAPK